ncbi:MAG: hypothetical protein M3153_02100 [Chloroflexota bacterium]|nr:hypothetical protein [Chloroflexota bacterium]
MTRRWPAVAALGAALTACAAPMPSITASAALSPSPLPSPSPTAVVQGVDLPEAGQPFDAEAILAAMRDSRRPGGVPDELETDVIAAAVSEAIWTIDGEPWTMMSTGGSCGPQACTLEVAGAGEDAPGEDLWVFQVTPATGAVEVESAELRSLPAELVSRLDELTRTRFPPVNVEGLNLTNVRWLPPPDETRFVLSYRDGNEERSSCGADVTIDAAVPEVVSDLRVDC